MAFQNFPCWWWKVALCPFLSQGLEIPPSFYQNRLVGSFPSPGTGQCSGR